MVSTIRGEAPQNSKVKLIICLTGLVSRFCVLRASRKCEIQQDDFKDTNDTWYVMQFIKHNKLVLRKKIPSRSVTSLI